MPQFGLSFGADPTPVTDQNVTKQIPTGNQVIKSSPVSFGNPALQVCGL